jgi:hypothetical protein
LGLGFDWFFPGCGLFFGLGMGLGHGMPVDWIAMAFLKIMEMMLWNGLGNSMG